MEEIQLTRIKSIWGEFNGFNESLQSYVGAGPYIVPKFITENYNKSVDILSQVTSTDYSRFKIPDSEIRMTTNIRIVKPQILAILRKLEAEYNFGIESVANHPTIAIFNNNDNSNSITINYTINDLIEKSSDEESKSKLIELKDELEKSSRDWDKIKPILIWIINFSKDLFIHVIAIVLEKRILLSHSFLSSEGVQFTSNGNTEDKS